MEALNNFILGLTDPVLGWMLLLPRDVALFIVAIGTALILTLVRLFTTNQEFLKRCSNDLKRLKELTRQAKGRKDKAAVKRHAVTVQQIRMKKFACEGKPLLASLVPIALLATWCFSRLGYLPPQGGQDVVVEANMPASDIGQMIYIVPTAGLESAQGWVRRIEPADANQPGACGVARWSLRGQVRREPYPLQIRYKGKTLTKELLIDGEHYSAPWEYYDDGTVSLNMPEYKPFTVIPGIQAIAFPPWIIGYLVIVFPFSFLLKPLLRIY